jgi:hypothetical protein
MIESEQRLPVIEGERADGGIGSGVRTSTA